MGDHGAARDAVGRPGQPDAGGLGARRRLPDDAIVTADSGSSANWYARTCGIRGGHAWSLSGTLATMGAAVPYAIGAKFAHPDRPAIALVGDGAMQMNGLAELLTIARYRDEWSDPRLVVCVFHNNDLNQVTWELRAMGGSPKFRSPSRCRISPTPTSRAPSGWRRSRSSRRAPSGRVGRALAADGPGLLDVDCDPEVPPIPPHATYEQIKDLISAVLRGDPNAWHLMYQGAKTKMQEFIPSEPVELMSDPMIVVGSGPAGVGAAETFRRHQVGEPVRVLTADVRRRTPVRGVSKEFLRGETDYVALHPPEWYTEHRIDLVHAGGAYRPDGRFVIADGQRHPYSALILACGSAPIPLPIAWRRTCASVALVG